MSKMLQKLPGLLALLSFSLAHATTESDPEKTYKVVKGDWLTTIALKKWGDQEKWRDLYKINEDIIKDSHWIFPGQRLRLLEGAEVEFFENRVASNRNVPQKRRHRSEEWRLLPIQEWQKFNFEKSQDADSLGFDRRSKVQKRFVNQTPVTSTIASDRLAVHGEIIHSRTEFEHVFLGDQVYIRADESLQVGGVYSVTPGPEKVRSKRDGRIGFIYKLLGKMRIIGVRDGTFIGTIVELTHPISRHNLLIPEVNPLRFQKAIPAPSNIVSHILMSDSLQQDMLGDHSLVFLDLGTNDGIQPGMIFRHYLHRDPFSKKDISVHDYLIESELMVLEAKDQFSTAIILSGKNIIRANAEVVALSDLTDFKKHMGVQTTIQDAIPVQAPDDLDRLDTNQGLGEKEERELHQLEGWNKTDEIRREVLHPSESTMPLGSEPALNDQKDKAPDNGEIQVSEPNSAEAASSESAPPVPETAPSQSEAPATAPSQPPATAPLAPETAPPELAPPAPSAPVTKDPSEPSPSEVAPPAPLVN